MKTNRNARQSRGDIVFNWINLTLLGFITLIILYPLLYVISASFSDPIAVTSGRMVLFPINMQLDSYREVFRNKDIMMGYRNSLLIMAIGTLFNLVMTVLAAYPLSRRDLYGRGFVMMIITFTMFFSGGIIPTYLLIKNLNMLNSWTSLILPGAISTYNMIIMRTFFTNSI
ncbi:MAG: carbohydrate ABC transporter permease, partial [Clostridia bacterium]